MVLIMLAGVMFPLWPVKLRIGVWYLSVGVLGLVGAFLGLAVVRLVFWCVTVLTMKRAIWIFPNLFEDVGFVSFVLSSPPPFLFFQLTRFRKIGRLVHPRMGLRRTQKEEEERYPRQRSYPYQETQVWIWIGVWQGQAWAGTCRRGGSIFPCAQLGTSYCGRSWG